MAEYLQQSKGPAAEGVCIAFIVIPAVFLAIRYYERISRGNGFGWDDFFIAVAFLCALGQVISFSFMVKYGFGKHAAALTDVARNRLFGKSYFSFIWFYPLAISSTKISILLLYKRIFTFHRKWFMILCYTTGVWVVLWTLSYYIACLALCLPLDRQWKPSNICHRGKPINIYESGFNVLSDIAVLVAPQPLIWNLHQSLKTRLMLSLLFALGAATCAISIARIPLLEDPTIVQDAPYKLLLPTVLRVLEPQLGVVCACCPMLAAFCSKIKQVSNSRFSSNKEQFTHDAETGRVDEKNRDRQSIQTDNTAVSEINGSPHRVDATNRSEIGRKGSRENSIVVTKDVTVDWVESDPHENERDLAEYRRNQMIPRKFIPNVVCGYM